MMTPITLTAPERWSWSARRLGIASATGVFAVGILYVAVIVLWLIIEATPREPIGDPYLAVMGVLTMVSALALLGLVIAEGNFGYATSGYQLQLKGLPPDRGNQFPAYCGATDGKWQVLAVSLSSDLAMPPPASR